MTMTTQAHAYDTEGEEATLVNPTANFRAAVRRGAYPVIPDTLAAALKARDELEQLHRDLYADLPGQQFPGVPRQAHLGTALLDALRSGEPAQEALAVVVDLRLTLDRRDLAATIVTEAQSGVDQHLRQTIEHALPDLFAGLRKQLETTVKVLRKAYATAAPLDINAPDPMDVAQATETQRQALVTIAEETKTYNRLRSAQTSALTASTLRITGNTVHKASYGWKDLFATGLHAVSNPGPHGLPGAGRAPRLAVHDVVTRDDVWLPDPEEMEAAYDRLEEIKAAWAKQDAADSTARQSARDHSFGELAPGSAALLDAASKNNAGPKGAR